MRDSASAVAASRRTFGPSWPGPASSVPIRRGHSSARLIRSTCGAGFGWWTWPGSSSWLDRRHAGIAVLGLAFKPNSDDIRDSLALNVAAQMRLHGASVIVTDPQAVPNAQKAWPDLQYADSAAVAAKDDDLVLLRTEWDEYRNLDPVEFGSVVAGKRILDGRNALDPAQWRAAGWAYRALGRK